MNPPSSSPDGAFTGEADAPVLPTDGAIQKPGNKRPFEPNAGTSRSLEERWQFALQGSEQGVWDWNPVTNKVYFSDTWATILGYDPAEIGDDLSEWTDRVHPDDLAEAIQMARDHLEGRTPVYASEHRMRAKDGTWRWIMDRGRVMERDDEGRPLRVVGTHIDITGLKQQQALLHRQVREQEAISELGQEALRVETVHELLARATAFVAATLDAPLAAVMQLLPDPGELRLTAGSGWKSGVCGHAVLRVEEVFQSGRLLGAAPPGDKEPGDATLFRQHGVQSGVSAWMEMGGSRWGVLGVYSTEQGRFTVEDGKFLQAAAAVISLGLARLGSQLALVSSDRRMREAQRVANLGNWDLDLATGRLAWSDEVYRIFEVHPEEFLPTYESFKAMVHPEDVPTLEANYQAALAGQARYEFEHRIICPSGKVRWVRERGELTQDADDNIVGFSGTVLDITELRAAQTRAEESERGYREVAARLTTTLESITDGFFTLDREWRFSYVNGEAERLLRRTREELMGGVIWDQFSESRGTAFEEVYRRVADERVTLTFEEYFVPLASWFEVRAYPLPEGVAVYFHDVTERRQAREALRASEERFREMAENIGDIFYNYDVVNSRLLYASRAYETMWGRPLADVLESPLSYLEAIHPEDRAAAEQALADQCAGRHTEMEFRVIRPDGTECWVREHAAPIFDASGRVERIVGTMQDVTRRKEAEDRLRESEERFRILARVANDAVWELDFSTGELWWSEGFEEVYGITREDVRAGVDYWISRIHPEDQPRVRDLYVELESGAVDAVHCEYRFRRKDGTYVPLLDRGRVIRDSQGRPLRMIGGTSDLSRRKQAETKLREQASLLDLARDAIMVIGLDQQILYWNKSSERVYGWSEAEAVGRQAGELLHRELPAFLNAVAATKAKAEWSGELEQFTKDGRAITVQGHWSLVGDERGTPKSMLVINTDVTERKLIEKQLLRAQRMESIGTLAGGIAHDLNNVLAPILMGVDLLKQEEKELGRLDTLATVESSARRGADMVRQLLTFAKGVDSRKGRVRIKDLIKEVEKLVSETFPKDILLQLEVAADLHTVEGDRTQLHQVLLNLCVNARDAMPHGGRLTLRAHNFTVDETFASRQLDAKTGLYVCLQVEDTGSGMSPDVLERIFEPFFTTKEPGSGTGLGLPTTQTIVRGHGGFIQVASAIGKGTTFKVYLPASASDRPSGEAPARQNLPAGAGEMVLVVDDEEPVRLITRKTLEAFGYQVLTASDGADAAALYALRQHEIDAVVTDMMMPVMDGAATIRAVLRMNPQARIIAVSGLDTSAMAQKAVQAGAKEFLPKPFTPHSLLEKLRDVLMA